MQIKRSCLICLILILTLAGCATHKQAFNKAAHQDVKTIGLLEPATSGEFLVDNLGHPGTGFGLVGGIVAAIDMRSKSKRFTELMKEREFKVVDEFNRMLAAELQNAGYSVKLLNPERPKQAFLEDYGGLDKDVDAYLDPTLTVGYFCASVTADYIPSVRTSLRLVKRGTNEILYQELIAYGYETRQGDAVTIAADNEYCFKDYGSLAANPEQAMEGLRRGLPLIIKRIATDLGR